MKTIELTQFIRPNGRKVEIFTQVSDSAYEKYAEIRNLSLRLTLERIPPNLVNICVEHQEFGDFDMALFYQTLQNL